MSGLFLVAIAVVGWMIYQKYFRALLAEGKVGRIKIAIIALGLVLLVLVVTGRAPAIFAALGALMTMVMRFLPLFLRAAPWLSRWTGEKTGVPGGSARVSQVRTTTLLMTFNAETGAMHGQILAGEYSGRVLDALSDDELESLHGYCRRSDTEGLRLLEAWLVRERPESWGAKPGTGGPGGAGASAASSDMSVAEACEILGVSADANRDDIVTAHRSLMVRLHPDKGGSHYLSAKVNEAKRVLLAASS
jgi:hypothetical protein